MVVDDPSGPQGKLRGWVRVVAATAILPAIALTAWLGAVALGALGWALEGYGATSGLARLYLFGGAASASYIVAARAPTWYRQIRHAVLTQRGPVARTLVGLHEALFPIFEMITIGILVPLLWPVALTGFLVWRKDQNLAAARVRTELERRELEDLRSAIRTTPERNEGE